MKEIDEKTQQALLLFNRRAENAEKESQDANKLKKAEKYELHLFRNCWFNINECFKNIPNGYIRST